MDNFVADAIFIDAPPDQVFEALQNPVDILVWMEAKTAVVDQYEGGEWRVYRADDYRVAGVIKVFRPADLTHQERLTHLLWECTPQYQLVHPAQSSSGAFSEAAVMAYLSFLEERLAVPIAITSRGPTAGGKRSSSFWHQHLREDFE